MALGTIHLAVSRILADGERAPCDLENFEAGLLGGIARRFTEGSSGLRAVLRIESGRIRANPTPVTAPATPAYGVSRTGLLAAVTRVRRTLLVPPRSAERGRRPAAAREGPLPAASLAASRASADGGRASPMRSARWSLMPRGTEGGTRPRDRRGGRRCARRRPTSSGLRSARSEYCCLDRSGGRNAPRAFARVRARA